MCASPGGDQYTTATATDDDDDDGDDDDDDDDDDDERMDARDDVTLVRAVPFAAATVDALTSSATYAAQYSAVHKTDGLIIAHRLAWYASDEVTPLCLVWKDATTSAWFVETSPPGTPSNAQRVVLRYDSSTRALVTSDDPPVRIARVVQYDDDNNVEVRVWTTSDDCSVGNDVAMATSQCKWTDGALVRVNFFDDTGAVRFAGLVPHPKQRGYGGAGADLHSKILFQHAARSGQSITCKALVDAAARE